MDIAMPSGAAYIISRLEEMGARADIVGGCVRDAMLGRRASDFDITTSASPEEVIAAFSDMRVIKTGVAHGTVTVIADGEPYEVTTYRIDGEYTDGRHPDSVTFAGRIEDDLSRRDFTVNAMAYSKSCGLTDLFGGREDVERRLIRAVGDPYLRFTEDALRILRAIRFASVLCFDIEPRTAAAARELAPRLLNVSAERIYAEWRKLIGGEGAYAVLSEYSDIIGVFLPELSGLCLPEERAFKAAGADARSLVLFARTCADEAPRLFHQALERLKADKKARDNGRLALENYTSPTETEKELLRLLFRLGEECAALTVELRAVLGLCSADTPLRLCDVIAGGKAYRITDLAVDGNDLISIGIFGKDIGKSLAELLELVIDGFLPNEKSALLSYLEKTKIRHEM